MRKPTLKKTLAMLLALVLLCSLVPSQVFAADTTVTGEPVTVKLGGNVAAQRENDFNKGWKFNLGDNSSASNPSFDDSAWQNVNLPHDFSITQHFTTDGEAESGFLPGGTGWYRKSFVLSEDVAGKTFILNFDGVYMHAYVYVNGTFVGEHHYGYTAFAFDITEYLECDGDTENVIAVKAVNQIPSSRWYSGSGIYRDVTLYALNPVHVERNGVTVTTPNIASGNGTANVKTELVNDTDAEVSATVTTKITEKGSNSVVATASTTVSVSAGSTAVATTAPVVSSPKLWSVEKPNLYTVVTEVSVNGEVMDTCEDDFGYRWTEWNSTGFHLNGKAVKLNGVCLHHDQGALGAAAYYDAMYRQLSIMKDMGCNAIRTSHNPADEQFIEICSELGLLVIEEHFDGITAAKNGNSNDFSKYFGQKANSGLYGVESDMLCSEYVVRSIVKRDRNEPSVFAWSYGNEIQEGAWADPQFVTYVEKYIEWTSEEDGTRIVTIGDNSKAGNDVLRQVLTKILNAGGVVGFNYHCHQANSQNLVNNWGGQWGCILASETSSHTNSRGRYQSLAGNTSIDNAYHLTSYDTSAVGWGDTGHDSMWDTLTKDYIAGEFVWTGFDYIGEPTPWNGTGTGDGGRGAIPNSSYFGIVETSGFPKDTYYLYRAQWNKADTTVHLVTAWDSDNQYVSSGKTPVWVYSNAAKVELYLNGSLIGTTNRTVNTTDAGHVYYTYAPTSNNTSVCTAQAGYNADSLYSVFNVAYTAGTLTAKAYDEAGNEIDTYSVTTPGAAAKLVATANVEKINANNSDLVYVEVDVTDADGNLKTTATNNITFTVEGPAEIAGVDNGDQATVRKYQNSYVLTSKTTANINAYAGKALVILRATDKGGEITLNIASNGLTGQTVTVTAEGGEGDENTGLVSYEMIRDYTVKAGTAPELNTAITGNLADGSTVEGTISWRTVSEELYAEAGDYTISGTASFAGYDDIRVSARLHVIPNVIALRNVATATMTGVAPVLPDMVSGVLADGTLSGEFKVEWDMPDVSVFDDEIGSTVPVSGTAVIFGEETLSVTCNVRLAEAVNTDSVNVAGAAKLSQDIPENKQSDNLNAINDGVRNPEGDREQDRWTNWNNRYDSDTATITLVWDTAQLLSDVNLFYRIDRDCAVPESVQFSYSLNGTDFVEVGHAGAEMSDVYLNNGTAYTYALDQVINPVALKITFTQQGGTTGGKCVGLYEVETMTYAATLEMQSSAALASILVDDTAIEGFDPEGYTYEIADGDITAVPAANIGITILPEYKGHVRILTVSEDGTDARTYDLAIEGKACKHENTEAIPAVAPNCTDTGLTEGLKCTDCGEILVKQEEIPALGHTEEIIPGKPATFDEPGLTDGKKCSVCGQTLALQVETPVLDYNEGIIPIPVLTATAGNWQRGYEATEGPANLVLDDNLSTMWHTDWNGCDISEQWIQFELSEEYLVDGLRYKPRSGSINGVITKYQIQVSNDGVTFETVASGEWANNANWKIAEFDAQNVKFVRLQTVEAQSDSGKKFSSAVEIRLTGVKAGGEQPHEHEWSDWTVTKAATCSEAGVETRTCECGASETREIAKLAHTEEVIPGKDATCTETGLTEGKKCSVCDEILVAQEEIPALGHEYVNGKCTRCGDTLTSKFEDVKAGVFYFDPVEWAVEKGITTGASDTLFNPDGNCQRAQVVTFLWRAAGSPEPTTKENPFTDVKEGDFFYKAVLWAVENEITNGLTKTTFGPMVECNRAQVVTFLWRAMGSPKSEAEVSFADVKDGQFYTTAVAWAVENDITNGISTTAFGVDNICNRAQVVTFLYRTYNK